MKTVKYLLFVFLLLVGLLPAVHAGVGEKGITVRFMIDTSSAMKSQDIAQITSAALAAEINDFVRMNSKRLEKLNVRILVDSFYQKGTALESNGIFDYRIGQIDAPKYEGLRDLKTAWFVEDETSLNKLVNRHWPPESQNTILVVLSNSQKTLSENELKTVNTDPRSAGSTLRVVELPRPSEYGDVALKAEVAKRLRSVVEYVNGKIKSYQSEMTITLKLNDKVVQLNENREALAQAPVNVTLSAKCSNITSFHWVFDNKKRPGTELKFTLENSGIYEIKAVGIDGIGEKHESKVILSVADSPKPVPNFTFFPQEGQAPLTITITNKTRNGQKYQWNWGDGSAEDSSVAPRHTYKQPGKYTITLIVLGSDGTVGKLTKDIVVKTPPPQAQFECKPARFNAGENVTFVNKSVHAVTYSWNFGDGGTSNEVSPVYAYKKAGRYNVVLTAVTADGRSIKTQKIVDVDVKLEAGFNYSVDTLNPRKVNFTSTSTGAVAYSWDFGDGSNSSEANPQHSYNAAKRYTVTLTVTGKSGKTESYSEPLRIRGGGSNSSMPVAQSLKADFSYSQVEGSDKVEYKFVNKCRGASKYHWDFGDGKTSSDSNPTHIYEISAEREVKVKLTASDNSGAKDYKIVTIKLKPVEQGGGFGIILLILIIIGGGLAALYFLVLRKKVTFTIKYFAENRQEMGNAAVCVNEEFSLEKVGCPTGLRCKIIKSEDSADDYQVIFRYLGDGKVLIKQGMTEVKLGGDTWSEPRSMFKITVNGGALNFADKNSEEGEE